MNGRVGEELRNYRLSGRVMVLDMYRDIRGKGVRWGIVSMVGLMVVVEICCVD